MVDAGSDDEGWCDVGDGGGGGGGPTGGGGGGEPTIAPGEAARRAVANLTLTAVPPELSPDWNRNEWKMLAVGFPVWVSADPDSLAPLSDAESVEGLTVELRAHSPEVSVAMGDGTTLTCATEGRPFVVGSAEPGSKGPCSHTYQELGVYTSTATYTWQVDWEAGGESGTIEVSNSASSEIPIGELHAVGTGEGPN
ncbi:hypothetical protein ACF3NT_09365 [Naumannella halotolerans]|uniref:PKD domain-containing protein n=1 Tax=Naumannella halotolerans TaxID=993414 RepID=A0A4R7J9N0_9ACTN|nr:hypothetical protein [Naumannella halotolerans]TDT34241.1 hypothetical protein CLV29_1898 [Naumannella halotolerans]